MRHLVVTIIVAAAGWAGAAHAQDVTGLAVALQGDQVTIDGARVSLYGIDAPDPDQDRECTANGRLFGCYSNAKRALESLIDEGPFVCTDTGERNYVQFPYMICTVNGKDVGEALVRAGFAVAFLPQTDMYAAAEAAARADQVGLWQPGVYFTLPWENREEFARPLFGP